MTRAKFIEQKEQKLMGRFLVGQRGLHTVKTFRVSDGDAAIIQSMADIYTGGSVDLWLRYAATHFRPGKVKLEQVITAS